MLIDTIVLFLFLKHIKQTRTAIFNIRKVVREKKGTHQGSKEIRQINVHPPMMIHKLTPSVDKISA